jgi:hypothetical protein
MIRTLRPSAAGASAQCAKVGDTANWKCVDESSSDGDTTHVADVTAGDGTEVILTDSYAMQDLPTGLLGAISKVRVFLVAKYNQLSPGHAKIRPQIRIGSTYYLGTEIDLTGSYASTVKEWTTSPATAAAFTVAEINASQGAQRLRALDDGTGTPTEVRSTQLYMEVEHVRVFQPTAAASMAMGGPQAAFYHPGPPALPAPPAKLSAALPFRQSGTGAACGSAQASIAQSFRQSGSVSASFPTSAIFALKLSRVDTVDGDF